MSDFELNDLTTPVTAAEWKASLYKTLELVGTDHTVWKSGSPVRTLIAGVSIALAALSALIALIAKGGFLEYATGSWLDLHGRNTFDETRQAATSAAGPVTLTNTGGGVFAIGVNELVVRNTVTDATYTNDAAINLGVGQTLTGVLVTCTTAGSTGSAAPGQITSFVTPLTGVTVTNPKSLVGLDAAKDDEYRAVCGEKRNALSPAGPADAYAYWAKKAVRSDGTSVGVTRVSPGKPTGNGGLSLYVATAAGAVPGDQNDPLTDLGAVADTIWKNVAPLAVTPDVDSAIASVFNVTYSVWVTDNAGLTKADVEAAINATLVSFFARQPVGGIVLPPATLGALFKDAVTTAIGSALPQIFLATVTSPASDTTLGPEAVPVLGTVTATSINFVSV